MIDSIEPLFGLLCEDFKKLLDGKEPMSSTDRKLLMEFLKDNEIKCVGSNNPHVKSIVDRLPFDENNVTQL